MKLKNFLEMESGTVVIVRGRRAKLIGRPQIFGGFRTSKEYGWAKFMYLDTKRSVTKRHRQVELSEKRDD